MIVTRDLELIYNVVEPMLKGRNVCFQPVYTYTTTILHIQVSNKEAGEQGDSKEERQAARGDQRGL